MLTVTALTAQAAITDGLIGHWAFDETSGLTAADSSSGGNPATVSNTAGDDPGWGPGKIGNALTFRGNGNGEDYVVVSDFPKPTTVFSASAWVLADPRDGTWPQSTILESGLGSSGPLGLVIRLKNRDQAFGPLGNTTTDGTGKIVLNETVGFPTAAWQHVGVVMDGTKIHLYRNGVEVAVADYDGSLASPPGTALGIGVTLDDAGTPTGGYWQGKIDDVGLWGSALTPGQMASIYNAGLAGKDLSQADSYQNIPPTIAEQPKGASRFVGESVSFSVKAAGTDPLSYQWKLNGKAIAGATSATLSLGSIKSSDAGRYVVTVSGPGGSIDSNEAVLNVQSAGLSTGLIGYWKFDETEGNSAADTSSDNHPGSLSNFPDDGSQWVQGQIGGALQFGGPSTKQFVVVQDYAKPTSTLTVSAWVYADQLGSWASFVKNWGSTDAGQFHFGIFADGQHENIYIKQADGKTPNVSDPDPFPVGEWQHVAVVCDGSKVRLYRNGAEVASTDYDGTLVLPPMNCIGIGAKIANDCKDADTGAPGFWQGKMDDVGVWNRGLSPDEIAAIYAKGQAGRGATDVAVSDGLIAYFPFNETAGLVAEDASGGNHPGALGNFAGDDTQWAEGQVGGSLQFGGPSTKQYVLVQDYAKPISTLTISAWAFADSLGSWASFVKNWGSTDAGQFHFGLFADGQHENIYIKQADGKTPNVSDPDPFPTGEWQHVAVVCDGSKIRLYRGGIEVASTDYDGTFVIPPMACIGIGAKIANDCAGPDTGAPGFWQGRLDEVGVWNRGLSADEIRAIFDAGTGGKPLTQAVVVARVSLSFVRSGNNLVFSWSQPGFVLQENADPTNAAGWANTVGGDVSPATIAIAGGKKYYRLVKP